MSGNDFVRVCVIGLGYIGLPTAAVLASKGTSVVGVDIDPEIVAKISRGEIHIVEPDLDAVTATVVANGRLRASLKPESADAFVIAVPTPVRDGHADMAYVVAAATSIAPFLKRGDLIVLESTSPPGTTADITKRLAEMRPDLSFPTENDATSDINVAYCPERVMPGRVLVELVENDRVIGGMSARCSARAEELYRTFCRGGILLTNAPTAEMCKLAENSFRDVGIAFANELSMVCDKLGINVWDLIRLANHHPRVKILQPGPGVGGHCIAVDPWFIVSAAPEQAILIRTAREVNDSKPGHVLHQIRAAIAEAKKQHPSPTVLLLGLAFKPDVDDLRESPALHIAESAASWRDCDIIVSEPHITDLPLALRNFSNIRLATDMDEAIDLAQVVVMLVNHRSYGSIAAENLKGKKVIDTRGVWS